MSHSRFRQLSLNVLWLAALTACATGVTEEFEDEPSAISGKNGGGAAGGDAGSTSVVPKAGTTGSGGSGSPFGGSANTGGKSTAGSAGTDVGEGGAGMSEGGAGGTGGGSAGSGGASAGSGGASAGSGGSGTGPCGCGKTLTWADNTVLSWVAGDCLTVGAATYKYTGTKAQTYANGQCNPTKQEAWCTDSGNDYKFMICP